MKHLIEQLKASEQNASGMFEIDEDTISHLMSILEELSIEYAWGYARQFVRDNDISFPIEAAHSAVNKYRLKIFG